MFAMAFWAFLLLVVAFLAIANGLGCLGEGFWGFVTGVVLMLVGCVLGAGSFMLFVRAVQLASGG